MSAARLFLLGILLAGAASAQEPNANGERLVKQYCSNCHPLETVYAQKHGEDEWTEILYRMIDHGLTAKPDELNAILAYMAKNPTLPGQKP